MTRILLNLIKDIRDEMEKEKNSDTNGFECLKQYYDELVRLDPVQMLSELSKEEKEVARQHFYKGDMWYRAFYKVCPDSSYDPDSVKKAINRAIDRHKIIEIRTRPSGTNAIWYDLFRSIEKKDPVS